MVANYSLRKQREFIELRYKAEEEKKKEKRLVDKQQHLYISGVSTHHMIQSNYCQRIISDQQYVVANVAISAITDVLKVIGAITWSKLVKFSQELCLSILLIVGTMVAFSELKYKQYLLKYKGCISEIELKYPLAVVW